MPWILIYYIRNMKFNSSEPIQIHSIKIIGMWPNFVKTTKAKFYKNIKKRKRKKAQFFFGHVACCDWKRIYSSNGFARWEHWKWLKKIWTCGLL